MQRSRTSPERPRNRHATGSSDINEPSNNSSFHLPWSWSSPVASPRGPDSPDHGQGNVYATHATGPHDSLPPGAENNTLQWPLIMLAVPPIGSLFFGTTQGWSDGITMILIGIYLYYLMKVPWELYYATQTSEAMRRAASATPQQRNALARLRRQEFFCLCMVLAAPLIGGYTLYLAKRYLSIANYLSPGNILLYMFAASLRPISHLKGLLEGRETELQQDHGWADTDAAQLGRRLDQLELSLRELRLACATEDEVDDLKAEVHTVLDKVAHGTKEQGRREKRARQKTAIRIDTAEERVREVEEWCELQREQSRHSLAVRFVWEPVSLIREAIGVSGVPLLGFGNGNDNTHSKDDKGSR